uniref:non-specific serine/threonine protein kinase n=1 Tax=Davidia involucrata TaxID=16924 RepID=A0A5B7BJ09_DAVIN
MVAYVTDSEHCNVSTEVREKAWHILAILLSIGRPACPEELALKCRLFCTSPDYVRFLCSIPNSPIVLIDERLIKISTVAIHALWEFVAKVIGGYVPRIGIRVLGSRRLWGDDVRTYFRKRKGLVVDSVVLSMAKRRLCLPSGNGGGDEVSSHLPNRIWHTPAEEPAGIADTMMRKKNFLPVNLPVAEFDSGISEIKGATTPILFDSNTGFSSISMTEIECVEGEHEVGRNAIVAGDVPRSVDTLQCLYRFCNTELDSCIPEPLKVESIMACKPDMESARPISSVGSLVSTQESQIVEMFFRNKIGFTAPFCPEVDEQQNALPAKDGIHNSHACEAAVSSLKDAEIIVEVNRKEGGLIASGNSNVGTRDSLVALANSAKTETLPGDLDLAKPVNTMTSDKIQTIGKVVIQDTFPSAEYPAIQKKPTKSIRKVKNSDKNSLSPHPRVLMESLEYNKAVNIPKQLDQCESGQKIFPMKQKSKQNHNQNLRIKENIVGDTSLSVKDQLEKKLLPNFESFIIEEEEGSGGYGTVYRARRKNDGKRFAIKCPHVNAHTHHVNNELKMLEQFGGRNFIIKYEGSFKNANRECFILEHFDHDRPEVLKREIDIFQLQWYGYCMFRALACLHKQGVVHRDVKPGNFLFSRKLNKGYLIDFNLAMDLEQKYGAGSKSKLSYTVSFDHVPHPHFKSASSIKDKKIEKGKSLEAVNKGARVHSKPTLELQNMKKRTTVGSLKAYPDLHDKNVLRSQGAEGSGITSTREVTSTRTPSAERLREPLPSIGRKELISLVQDVMQSPNHDAVNIPSQRKRVAAPPNNVDRIVYLSPMPLHSTGVAVSGSGLLKSKGDGKPKREGPCVGTKGFRAPEVLFRSLHQSCKIDIWSAGVTLLYLMVGRTPFIGDPEQNIKDTAKLRGSEDLWEVAKLHNRESSFPVELFDIQYFPSVELQNWCKTNTKRPEFLKLIPRSLFDLVDKCLTVNPRLRITAEEALRHEFFAPCHESLRKQRMLRQGFSLDSTSDHFVCGQSQVSVNI